MLVLANGQERTLEQHVQPFNLVCSNMGRHAHKDYYRAQNAGSCNAQEAEHIHLRVDPNPERAKDWISHKLYWRRTGELSLGIVSLRY